MPLIGYARVSTDEQSNASQVEELRAAGCSQVHEEHGSGGSRERPTLRHLCDSLKADDTLVVVRLDRLARSLSHLLEVIERLEAKAAHFKSLRDPVDTSSPQGKFTLQVLGAAAELERALNRERTLSGLRLARSQGRIGGNPGLRSQNAEAIRKVRDARDQAHFRKLERSASQWVPEVRRLRPDMPWEDVTRIINAKLSADTRKWSIERLKRATRRYVREGLIEPQVLDRAPRTNTDDRLLAIVAGIAGAAPKMTLAQIANRLENMRERTPRGRSKWSASSVKMLLDRAKSRGMLD